jgi:transposase
MGKPLSMDLRERLIEAIDAGLSRRAAAARYGVAPSTAIRWDIERRSTGSFAPKPQGGDMRSRRIEANARVIHAALEETPDITLAEFCKQLSERGIAASTSSLWRFFRRHGITRKKRPGTPSNRIARTS